MQYIGGKNRVALAIGSYLQTVGTRGQVYYEPFVGALNIPPYVHYNKMILGDSQRNLVDMYRALFGQVDQGQTYWLPPTNVTYEDYLRHKACLFDSPDRTFIGYACSYAGKWYDGYARDNLNNVNFAEKGCRALLNRRDKLLDRDLTFVHGDYSLQVPNDVENAVIYCDPPYEGTKKVGHGPPFNHERFWSWVRVTSLKNTVIVSESAAPEDFVCVKQIPKARGLRAANRSSILWERLFRLKDQDQGSRITS